jgi:hypothetical protein
MQQKRTEGYVIVSRLYIVRPTAVRKRNNNKDHLELFFANDFRDDTYTCM